MNVHQTIDALIASESNNIFNRDSELPKEIQPLWTNAKSANYHARMSLVEGHLVWVSDDVMHAAIQSSRSLPDTTSFPEHILSHRYNVVWFENPLPVRIYRANFTRTMIDPLPLPPYIKRCLVKTTSQNVGSIHGLTVSMRPPVRNGSTSRAIAIIGAVTWLPEYREMVPIFHNVIPEEWTLEPQHDDTEEDEIAAPLNNEHHAYSKDYLRVLVGLLLFMDQRIVHTTIEIAPRAIQRRISRQQRKRPPEASVITLRRVDYGNHKSTGESGRTYGCQWIVDGHWRNQWYPKEKIHRPKFIMPHVKGPKDKPLKTKKVYAVVR